MSDKKKPIQTGEYTAERLERIKKYGTIQKLEKVIEQIKNSGFEAADRITTIDLSEPKEPCFFVQYNEYIGIQCILFPSSQDNFVTSIKIMRNPAPKNKKEANMYLNQLADADAGTGLTVKGSYPKRYARIQEWKPMLKINDIEKILFRINSIWDFLQKNDPHHPHSH